MDKKRLDYYIGIYVEQRISSDSDAGFHGDSILAKAAEYAGYIPHGTGNDQSNLQSIKAIAHLRTPHRLYRLVDLLMGKLTDDQRLCVMIDWLDSKRRYTREQKADACLMTVGTYRRAIETGRASLEANLEFYLDLKRLEIVA